MLKRVKSWFVTFKKLTFDCPNGDLLIFDLALLSMVLVFAVIIFFKQPEYEVIAAEYPAINILFEGGEVGFNDPGVLAVLQDESGYYARQYCNQLKITGTERDAKISQLLKACANVRIHLNLKDSVQTKTFPE